MTSNKFFPGLSAENYPPAASIVTADRVIYIDRQSVIRMVGMVGEAISGSADYQAHTVPASVVTASRIEPGADAPAGFRYVGNPFTGN